MPKMNIRELINKKENPKLDFKRQWYKEADVKTEFIKDVVALANGNIHTIGQNSFLIIGVKEHDEGNELHDVVLEKSLDDIKKQLLQNLQKYAIPAIQDIYMEEFAVDSKTILVIQIPFHPYPIIIKERLKQFDKDTLIYRAGEGTVKADFDTRTEFVEAIRKYKQVNPNPTPLTEITNDLPQKKDPKHLTSLPPINTKFIGREDELKAIEKNLSSDNVVCVVNGIGGVGKSELSYRYLHEHKEQYNKIAFIEFTEESRSLEETFYFKFQDTFQLTEKDTLETIIKRLQGLKPKNLMVLDNLQSNEDFNKIKALNTNFDLLITTRAKFDTPNILNLETLNDTDAKELFLDIYKTTENIDSILKYLDNHPLFITLTAYSLNEEYIELDELRADIASGKVTEIDSKDDKTFQEHLHDTFDRQFKNEQNSELKAILQILALFPAIEIEFEILKQIIDDKKLKVKLQKLVARGWLSKKENSYKLHQIIKTFILTSYPAEYEDITFVLENIGNYIDPDDNTLIANQLSDYIPIINSLLSIFKDKGDKYIIKILDSNTYLHYSLGEYDNSLKMQEKALKLREKLYDDISEEIAESYILLGVIYDAKGEYDKAEPLYEKDLKICEEVLGESHPDTASSYNNLASLYDSKGEYDKAEPLFEKALKIREEVLGESHPDTASSYNNLASLYKSKGEYDKAEPLYEKALKICEEVLGESHPDTASSYRNLGLFYQKRKQCAKAKEYLEKAIGSVERLEYPHISLIDLRRALRDVEKSMAKEKKAKFNKKGKFCVDMYKNNKVTK